MSARDWLEKSRKQAEWPDGRVGDRVVIRMQADALVAVLDLHKRRILPGGQNYCQYCWNSNAEWPCPTVSAIDKALGVTDE